MRSTAGAVLVLLGLCACLSAQESAIQIPLLDRSAKAAASGEAGAFLSGLDALGVNPAGLADAKREWNATYRAMPLDTSVNGMAIGVPIASIRTTLAVSYTALRSAGLERRDENGALQGEFRHEDQMAGLHAAAPFQWGPVAIDGGVSVKSIQSRIDRYSGSGLAVDAGLRHKFDGVPLTVASTPVAAAAGDDSVFVTGECGRVCAAGEVSFLAEVPGSLQAASISRVTELTAKIWRVRDMDNVLSERLGSGWIRGGILNRGWALPRVW